MATQDGAKQETLAHKLRGIFSKIINHSEKDKNMTTQNDIDLKNMVVDLRLAFTAATFLGDNLSAYDLRKALSQINYPITEQELKEAEAAPTLQQMEDQLAPAREQLKALKEKATTPEGVAAYDSAKESLEDKDTQLYDQKAYYNALFNKSAATAFGLAVTLDKQDARWSISDAFSHAPADRSRHAGYIT